MDVKRLAAELDPPSVERGGSVRVRGRTAFARRNLLDLPFVRELAASDAVASLPRLILGDDARPVRGILFDKTPGANWVVPWHQDLSIAIKRRLDVPGFGPWSEKAGVVHVQPPAEVLRRMLTVRLHLDNCCADNGPLRVIPGSHRDPMTPEQIANAVNGSKQFTCECPASGAVAMRPMILHASSPARSPAHRRVVHIEYATGDLPGGLQWHAN